MKAIRYVAIGLAALVGLGVIAAVIVSLAFDPNRYKPEIIQFVKDKTGRTLTIDGKIGLTFIPRLGMSAEKLALSGPGGTGTFASAGEAKVAVALLPLLAKRVVIDQVDLSQFDVEIIKHKNGTTNFDDLAGRDAKQASTPASKRAGEPGQAFALDIGGVRIRSANVLWRDEGDGRSVRLAGLDARTGRIAEGASGKLEIETRIEGSKPEVNLQLKGSGGYHLEPAKGAFGLDDMDVKVTGDAPDAKGLVATVKGDFALDPAHELIDIAKLTVAATTADGLDLKASVPKLRLAPSGATGEAARAEMKLAQPERAVTAKLALSPLSATGKRISFERLGIDADVTQGDAKFAAKVASPLTIDFDAKIAELATLAGDLVASGPQIPQKSVKGSVSGGARIAWGKPSGATADLAAKLEDSNLKVKVAVANLDAPAIQFDVSGDRLDVDRYLPPSPPEAKRGGAPAGGGAESAATSSGGTQTAAVEKPIDLSALRTLNANGSMRVGSLSFRRIKAQNVNVGLHAAGGRLDFSPLNATLYQGALTGSASVNANANQFSIREQLTGVALGPLLRDAAGFDRLEGRGNVSIDVTTTGTTVAALKRGLNGSARIDLRDGAVKGVNLGEIVKTAGALLGSRAGVEGQGRASDQTEFAELSGSFAIRNGVARNDDLVGRSPLLKVAGAGTIDIGADRIDYLVKATPVGAIPIGGGRQITALQGVAVPVRIAGPLTAPGYSVDAAALAAESAKTGVKLTIEKSLGAPSAAPLVDELLRGLRGKK